MHAPTSVQSLQHCKSFFTLLQVSRILENRHRKESHTRKRCSPWDDDTSTVRSLPFFPCGPITDRHKILGEAYSQMFSCLSLTAGRDLSPNYAYAYINTMVFIISPMNTPLTLVGGKTTPLKIMSSSVGMMTFPIWMESHKFPWFQTTNQWLIG